MTTPSNITKSRKALLGMAAIITFISAGGVLQSLSRRCQEFFSAERSSET